MRPQALVEDIDQNFPQGRFNWAKLQVNDAAALLKRFLRQLPIPLLTSELLGAFRKVLDLEDREKQLEVRVYVILLTSVLFLYLYFQYVGYACECRGGPSQLP